MRHPSLVLWNGCNENIWGWFDWGWQRPTGDRTWGLGYYLDVLPAIVGELDPTTPYWPGSPYSGSMDVHPNDPGHGNVHIWDVWNRVDYTGYAEYAPRFVSEFGFQGPPTWATLTRSISRRPLSPDAPAMVLHQKADDGNGMLARGMAGHLPEPTNMDDWHYLTQLNQARAVRFGIDHYRSQRGSCMGTIVWQLNDCWPVTSWAAIDGDGRRKPLWYALRDASRERVVILGHSALRPTSMLVNDSTAEWDDELTLSVRTFTGDVVAAATVPVRVAPLSREEMPAPPPVAAALARTGGQGLVLLATTAGGLSSVRVFGEDVELPLGDPELELEVGAWRGGRQPATLTSARLARGVCLFADRVHPDAWADAMAIDVVPGITVEFDVHSPVPLDARTLGTVPVLRSVNDVIRRRTTPLPS